MKEGNPAQRGKMMRECIRIFIAACFYYSGLVRFTLWLQSRMKPRLIILVYHRAPAGNLRRQLLYLHKHYRILHLEAALHEFYKPPKGGKQVNDRRPLLALTFDDGYRDNYTYAFPLARHIQMPFTIFLIPGYIESGKRFWWLEGEHLVNNTQVEEVTLEGCTYFLRNLRDRAKLAQAIDARVRFATSVAAREAFLDKVHQILAVPSGVPNEEASRTVTWEEVREMDESGWVSFGAHTMHHPILTCLSDAQEMRNEIEWSRKVLEQKLGHSVTTFAYPIGLAEHFGDESPRIVKEVGFKWALTAIEAPSTLQSDPYLLERLPGDETVHWLVMASELVGLLGIFSRMRKRFYRCIS